MRISDWSSDVCSSDLDAGRHRQRVPRVADAEAVDLAGGQGIDHERRRYHHQPDIAVGMNAAGGEPVAQFVIVTGKREDHAEGQRRSEEHTSELQSLMRISYAVFCLKKKRIQKQIINMITPYRDYAQYST